MCTVTYIPQEKDSFILSSNRDEAAFRSPRNITLLERANESLLFPRDSGAGGSWIAASSLNRVVCLLNGAFHKHHHNPPYKRSRGLMVLDFFDYETADLFARHYDFSGMEPFTMVMVDQNNLSELRWDEQQAHYQPLNPRGKYIWSSASLYPAPVQEERNQWFADWQKGRADYSLEAIRHFHKTGGAGDTWNGFIMNRQNLVQTVSISNIIKASGKIRFLYEDLINQANKEASIQLD